VTEARVRRTPPPEADVAAMFDDVVDRYGLVNSILSLGLDRLWRRAALRAAATPPGTVALDLGCGTGELTASLARAGVRAVGVDASAGMIAAAHRGAAPRTAFVRGSAFRLPFAPASFDAAVSAFVLRNLADLPGAFAEIARVLRPGAPVALVDITEPPSDALRRLFDAYFGVAAPALGSLVGHRDAYRYLARSVEHLPPATDLCAELRRAGFDRVRAHPLTGGMVTLFSGRRAGSHPAADGNGQSAERSDHRG
jgi:demethylmenaquinone methyltransferase/2-methoxy-6-polyprenyl-1,4-benzoquinol methylase